MFRFLGIAWLLLLSTHSGFSASFTPPNLVGVWSVNANPNSVTITQSGVNLTLAYNGYNYPATITSPTQMSGFTITATINSSATLITWTNGIIYTKVSSVIPSPSPLPPAALVPVTTVNSGSSYAVQPADSIVIVGDGTSFPGNTFTVVLPSCSSAAKGRTIQVVNTYSRYMNFINSGSNATLYQVCFSPTKNIVNDGCFYTGTISETVLCDGTNWNTIN